MNLLQGYTYRKLLIQSNLRPGMGRGDPLKQEDPTNMTTQYDSSRSRSSGTFLVVILSLVLGAVALAVFLRHATSGILARVATAITGRATTYDTSVPAVVQRIQRLNRLETVVYSIDTVVEGSKSSVVLRSVSSTTIISFARR